MRSFTIVATKGRAREITILLDCLQRQTSPSEFTVLVGTEDADIAGAVKHSWINNGHGVALVSSRTGTASQRNYGLEVLERQGFFEGDKGRFFCAFFDDDFRMADNWLESVGRRFAAGDIAGLTGRVLGDGVKKGGHTEEYAMQLLQGLLPPEEHWASGSDERDVGSVYGCNMAFTDTVIRSIRFDENLPLYGWQEDRDYTGQARKIGRIIYYPAACGVHLGAQSGGRMRGLRFGYSQIANPIYLMRKGTMESVVGMEHVCRALASNILHSLARNDKTDYRGRLHGNFLAVLDLLRFRLDPKRILSL